MFETLHAELQMQDEYDCESVMVRKTPGDQQGSCEQKAKLILAPLINGS